MRIGMVLKSEIEIAYTLQMQHLNLKKDVTKRQYLTDIKKTGQFIEVISGVRRCGKSTLLMQIMQQYKKNIAYFNFEDSRVFNFDASDFPKLDEIIGKGKAAYFFDEIQNVPAWEIFIRELHDRGEKVFITGSNASLLSKELGTRLTGRHIRHELFPFSYTEFLSHKKLKNSVIAFDQYVDIGGFPNYLDLLNVEILQTLLKDIVLRDIAVRYGIRNTKNLLDITYFLISNISKEFTFNSIKKNFSIGSINTVTDYLAWLEDCYLLFYLPRFSWSSKRSTSYFRKVYAIDNGLVTANSLSFSKDKGRLLENAVYLFLHKKYENMFYFREKGECDFVIFEKNKCTMLLQVCEEIHSENKEREVNGLLEAMVFFKLSSGIIITKNQKDHLQYDQGNIELIPANQFMIE